MIVEGEVNELEGCYLHYNRIRHVWIRSGKVVGSSQSNGETSRNFKIRQDEHANCARCNTKSSRFYSLHPDEQANTIGNIRRGFWHHLHQYCGIGFSRKEGTKGITDIEDGLFMWDENSIKKIENLKLIGCTTIKEKQLVMVGYALELECDVMIAAFDSVSQSPGFESCLGIFGGE